MVEPCIDAIDAFYEDDFNKEIEMPEGVFYKGKTKLRRLMELRRSNAASAVPNKKKYDRKKCQSLMLELKKERGPHD
jgi:hypothetical protein